MKPLLLLTALVLGACAPSEWPVGIGRDTDEFKASPCACGEPFYRGGQWVEPVPT